MNYQQPKQRSAAQHPMPMIRVEIALNMEFSEAEYGSIVRGRTSSDMGDKWDIFFEAPWLYVHRSWSGACRYAVRIEADGDRYVTRKAWLNADPAEDPASVDTALVSLSTHTVQLQILLHQMAHRTDGVAVPQEWFTQLLSQRGAAPDAELAAALARARNHAASNAGTSSDSRLLLGAICGDVIGSSYEALGEKRFDVPLFTDYSRPTDDTYLSCAVAQAVMLDRPFAPSLRSWGKRHLMAGYGQGFERWMHDESMGPYGSSGNGSAMRVSAVGLAGWTMERTLEVAAKSADCTHNHPEGIQGARAVALAVWLARQQLSKEEIRRRVAENSGYDLSRSLAQIRPDYGWSASCRDSVPEAITCFLEADDYEHAVRNVLSLGGDADTMAAMAGAISAAFWGGVPRSIADECVRRLPVDVQDAVNHFAGPWS